MRAKGINVVESAFAWVGEIFRYIGAFIPRPFIVTTTEGGVKWKCGRKVVELKPGIHIYWPLTTRTQIIPVVRQAMIFTPVALMTADIRTVSIGATIVFEVEDVVMALTVTDNILSTISEAGQTVMPPLVVRRNLDELIHATQADDESSLECELNQELTEYTKRILREYGIKVIYC